MHTCIGPEGCTGPWSKRRGEYIARSIGPPETKFGPKACSHKNHCLAGALLRSRGWRREGTCLCNCQIKDLLPQAPRAWSLGRFSVSESRQLPVSQVLRDTRCELRFEDGHPVLGRVFSLTKSPSAQRPVLCGHSTRDQSVGHRPSGGRFFNTKT